MLEQMNEAWQHRHTFNTDKQHIERKTRIVVLITLAMMIAEILAGWLTNSMALLADGWHMGTHAFALGISLLAYILARKHSSNDRFAFGTWKIEILGAYSSALVLGLVALMMVYSSVERLLKPLAIHYNQALLVAFIGLGVNLVCAIILGQGGHAYDHHHEHGSDQVHEHGEGDLNLRSAYLHVLADALTSVFAIVALLGAKHFQYNWLDPAMGFVGAFLIARWSVLLLRDSAAILLDHRQHSPIEDEIRSLLEADGQTRVCDLHLLRVGDDSYACVMSLVTVNRRPLDEYKALLAPVHELAHITIEIHDGTCGGNLPPGHKVS